MVVFKQDGSTAVMHTTMAWWRHSRLKAMRLLIEAKADVNIPNKVKRKVTSSLRSYTYY